MNKIGTFPFFTNGLQQPFQRWITFVQSTRLQRSLKTMKNLSCWYSLGSLTGYFQMSTHMPGFQSFPVFLHYFVLAKLAISSLTVKVYFKLINGEKTIKK